MSENNKRKSPLRSVWITLAVLLVLTIWSLTTFDWSKINGWQTIKQAITSMKQVFLSPQLQTISLKTALLEVLRTIAIAFITTFLSVIVSFFLGLWSSNNLGNKYSIKIINIIVSFIRSVPTVMWVLIFAVVVGLGSEAAILGIMFHSVAYLTRVFAQTFEEMDQGIIEALQATGASWWQIVGQAVLPTTARTLISWSFMRLEINYVVALGMGAAAGAGGIGYNLFMAGNYYYNMSEVGAITYLILISCFIFEFISKRFEKYIEK